MVELVIVTIADEVPMVRRPPPWRPAVGEEYQLASRPFIFLATVQYLRGEYGPAREQIEHILGVQQRTLGDSHIDIARSWIVLGKILTRTGDVAGGETYLRKALDLRTKAFPETHWRTAEAQSALADCLIEQGRHEESEPLLVSSHAVFAEKFGRQDPRTLEISRLVVRLYDGWGKPQLAGGYR